MQWKWYANYCRSGGTYYAKRGVSNIAEDSPCMMHGLILGLKKHDGRMADHKDRNTLNNQKYNLRISDKSTNNMNKCGWGTQSEYKGICFKKINNKWQARIQKNYKQIYIGLYKTDIEAAKAYNEKAKELFGEFAYLNKV